MICCCLNSSSYFASNNIAADQIPYVVDHKVKPVLGQITNSIRQSGNHEICDNFVFEGQPKTKEEQGWDSTPKRGEGAIVSWS